MKTLASSLALALIAFLGSAHAQSTTFHKTVDDKAEDVAKASKRYHKDRKEYAEDVLQLIKGDNGEVLAYRPKGPREVMESNMAEFNAKNRKAVTNEWHFNIEKAPEEALRSVGMASDLRESKQPNQYWSFNKSPKQFEALYGAPAYTVVSEFPYCYNPGGFVPMTTYKGNLKIGTYIDVDKDGNSVEIHVHTCQYTEGPQSGESEVVSISPVMATVNYGQKFASKECLVRANSTIGTGRSCK